MVDWAGKQNWYENLVSTWRDGIDRGSNCRSCLLSDVKDRLWTLYSRRAGESVVISATSLYSVKGKIINQNQRV